MSRLAKPERLHAATLCHIGLIEKFIEMAQVELDHASDAFTRESLNDLLDTLRDDLKGHYLLLSSIPAANTDHANVA